MRKGFVYLCLFICLILFNLSYFSNSGLLIYGLKRAERISYKNAILHTPKNMGPLSLSQFRMEQILNEEESRSLSNLVINDPILARRNAAMSTVGTASYLDGSNMDQYIRLSATSNPHMESRYKDILGTVIEYFRSRTTARVEYRESAALPGFHVFDCNNLFAMPVASVHKDLQFLRIKLGKDEEIDAENTMSFTLAIQLPEGGGGLYTFDSLELPTILNHIIPHPLIHSFASKTKIEYKVGWIVTHGGQTYHMIAPCKQSKTQRITLQGHGVYEKNSNIWWLYW